MSPNISFMKRGSMVTQRPSGGSGAVRRSTLMRTSMLGTTARREMLAIQMDLDSEIFDSSLGCPLASYQDATLSLVGGKALQCWRLMKQGFPVPEAFVLPTYVYSMHIADAGAVDLINDVFASHLADEAVRETTREKLATIRERIMSTPLNPEVVENLQEWMDALHGAPMAVRSSGSAEDLAGQSFAGQYDTFLYKTTIEEVSESIKACWASMFKDHILDYATKSVFLSAKEGRNTNEPRVYTPGAWPQPRMGVLVMKMVEAKASGVIFTRNLWGEKNEVMIEAVYGQGEGLVNGEITPDRFVLDKGSNNLCYEQLSTQTHKFVRASNTDGIIKAELSEATDVPVLNIRELKAITRLARAVEEFYGSPQDIEFAIDISGSLFLLQARPITTIDDHGSLSFLPPGEGFWTFDPTHFPRPVTPHLANTYDLSYSGYCARRMGCLIKDIKFRFVHSFVFTQPEFYEPSDAFERAAEAYWTKRLYEDDYREFTDFFRPECEALQEELRSVNPYSLSHQSLVSYVARCYDLAAEFWKRHHTYTFPAFMVVGDFANRMGTLLEIDTMDTLALLENASPESRGLLNREDPLLAEMYSLLSKSERALKLLTVDEVSAKWALDCLLHLPDRLGTVMREVVLKYGWRLAGGYDLIVPCLIESPYFFLNSILQGVKEGPDAAAQGEARARELADELKSKLPEDKHEEFEEILDVGRRFFRLRDERGLCTDLSGVGLCRRGILEGGRRLAEQGIIYEAEHLCVATKSEAVALLRGDLNLLSSDGTGSSVSTLEIPTPRELERRYRYIKTADPSLIPRALGTPPPPPDFSALPAGIARTMGAFATAGLRGVWDERTDDEDEDGIRSSPDAVKGVPASMGITEGPVCLVLEDDDLQKVKKGDIVVTYSCSASFNIVLALCAGVCTDYGGMLSHAAIVSREYGIPAVVGTQNATAKFKDGDIVRIDSSSATVRVVKRKE